MTPASERRNGICYMGHSAQVIEQAVRVGGDLINKQLATLLPPNTAGNTLWKGGVGAYTSTLLSL